MYICWGMYTFMCIHVSFLIISNICTFWYIYVCIIINVYINVYTYLAWFLFKGVSHSFGTYMYDDDAYMYIYIWWDPKGDAYMYIYTFSLIFIQGSLPLLWDIHVWWWWWCLLRWNHTTQTKNYLPYVKYRPARKGIHVCIIINVYIYVYTYLR
jgi:hypothetical protein